MDIFDMSSHWDDEWSSDNKTKPTKIKQAVKPILKHKLKIHKEKRRGKIVTIVEPFYLESNEIKNILKQIKKSLGTGGTIKNISMEFQGEVSQKLIIELQKIGFKI